MESAANDRNDQARNPITCTGLYCTILYCTVLYYTVLYCTVLNWTVLYKNLVQNIHYMKNYEKFLTLPI